MGITEDFESGKIFYIRKFNGSKVGSEFSRYQTKVEGRLEASPSVATTGRHKVPLYTAKPWDDMSGLIFAPNTKVAAAYKYHALTNQLHGMTEKDRFHLEKVTKLGGRPHTAEELQAKFLEWSVKDKTGFKCTTKSLINAYVAHLRSQPQAEKNVPVLTYKGLDEYLKKDHKGWPDGMDETHRDKLIAAHMVSVKSRYAEYFCHEKNDEPKVFPGGGLQPKKTRQNKSAQAYHDINEILLLPTMNDVVAIYFNPQSAQDAFSMYHEYYTKTGKSLPLCTYDQRNGLQLALLNKNVLNTMDKNGHTVLTWAAQKGHADVVSAIIKSPHCTAEVLNAQNKYGSTALSWAADKGHLEIVKTLLEKADALKCTDQVLNIKSKGGDTALMWAADRGHTETVRVLLEKADALKCTAEVLNAKNNDGYTALICTAGRGHPAVAKTLLEKADALKCTDKVLNAKSNEGKTALIWAAQEGHTEVVKTILASDRCTTQVLNAKDKWGYTALIRAAFKGHTEIVNVLKPAIIKTAMNDLVTCFENKKEGKAEGNQGESIQLSNVCVKVESEAEPDSHKPSPSAVDINKSLESNNSGIFTRINSKDIITHIDQQGGSVKANMKQALLACLNAIPAKTSSTPILRQCALHYYPNELKKRNQKSIIKQGFFKRIPTASSVAAASDEKDVSHAMSSSN